MFRKHPGLAVVVVVVGHHPRGTGTLASLALTLIVLIFWARGSIHRLFGAKLSNREHIPIMILLLA